MELFDEACDLPPHGVSSFLDGLPPADQGLKTTLAAMLEADRGPGLHTRGVGAAMETALGALDERPLPDRLGDFQLIEKLGQGAMGTVYLARQGVPSREVALKVLHPWLLSTRGVERFRFEAEALAALEHPSIPPIYAVVEDAGYLALAMQVVRGTGLLQWSSSRTVPQRLELLARIAEAVHHAHLRGLVHRDLKPENLRVTDEGVPQVLDFGIAAGLRHRRCAGRPGPRGGGDAGVHEPGAGAPRRGGGRPLRRVLAGAHRPPGADREAALHAAALGLPDPAGVQGRPGAGAHRAGQ